MVLEKKVTQAGARMDYLYLRTINLQLETLIQERQRKLCPGLGLLFEAGCGFTDFLVRIKENYKEGSIVSGTETLYMQAQGQRETSNVKTRP